LTESERHRGSLSSRRLIALLLGTAALMGVQAFAAAQAGAVLLEYCTDVNCGAGADGGGGTDAPSLDEGGIPADPNSWQVDRPADPATGQISSPDSDYAETDKDTSSFVPKNDGLDPSPFEKSLLPIDRDDQLLVPWTNVKRYIAPFTQQECGIAMSALNDEEDSLQVLVTQIRNPGKAREWAAKELQDKGVQGARAGWRADASEKRQNIRHYRALFRRNDCDTVLVGRDY
jgi:hypothetical protein